MSKKDTLTTMLPSFEDDAHLGLESMDTGDLAIPFYRFFKVTVPN